MKQSAGLPVADRVFTGELKPISYQLIRFQLLRFVVYPVQSQGGYLTGVQK